MKYIIILFSALTLSLTSCSDKTPAQKKPSPPPDKVTFKLSIVNNNDLQNAFIKPGEYTAENLKIFMYEGIFSGIVIGGTAVSDKEMDTKLNFGLQLISDRELAISMDKSGKIAIKSPKLPFQVKKEYSKVTKKNKYGMSESSYLIISRKSSETENFSVNFKKFTIKFTTLKESNRRIIIDCTFTGTTNPEDRETLKADYTIEGHLVYSYYLSGMTSVD